MKENARPSHNKTKLLTIATVLLLPLVLTACTLADVPFIGQYFGGSSDGGAQSLGEANLTVWGLWENPDVINTLVQRFSEVHPSVSINYDDRSILKPLVEYKERVFARATDETGPDIMRVHVSWVPRLANSLVPAPKSVITVEEFTNSFYPSAIANLVFGDEVYGIPNYYDGLVLVYNKDHFAEIGQTEAPTAWEEFRRLALQLTIRGEQDTLVRAGAAMGTASNIDFFSDILGMLFAQGNVAVPGDLDTQAARHALEFYTNFVLEDAVWSNEMPEASVAFAQEKASMIFVPTWNLLDIVTAHPEMNIGVAPVPQVLPDEPASWATYWVDVVPLSSSDPDAAWAFIKFMSEADQQLLTYSEASKFRVFGAPFSLVSLSSELSSNPYISPALNSASFAEAGILANRAGNRREISAAEEAINGIFLNTNQLTVEEALINIKAELSK